MRHRDPLPHDDLGQVPRIPMPPGRATTSTAPRQRPEELPHRHVEPERCLLQHPVTGTQTELALHPRQPVHHTPMRHRHTLGTPGGTGGVDHIRRMLRNQRGRALRVGHVRAVQTGQLRVQSRIVQHQNRQRRQTGPGDLGADAWSVRAKPGRRR